jgi:nucleoid-associated protein YgaU
VPEGGAPVRIVLHTLPVIAGMLAADDALGANWKLRAGLSAETSGGLLVALPSLAAAQAYAAAVAAADGKPAWVVGRVEAAAPGRSEAESAVIEAGATYVEVDYDV